MSKLLPSVGKRWEEIEAHLTSIKSGDIKWREGRSTKSAFHASEELLQVATRAYNLYLSENALFAGGFASVQSLERDVVQIALGLLGGADDACGTFTSGGSESNFMAVYAAREYARRHGRLNADSNIVTPISAHVTVNKAAHLLGVKVVRSALADDHRGDAQALAAAIDENTIMVVGSAPCWPFGVVDPIPAFVEAAEAVRAWVHVDACVGGFSLPFVRALGRAIPPFDLSVPGVHSMSADIHKYGFTPKGASLILFASSELKEFSSFEFDRWPSGFYKTYTFQGSRTAGAIAAAWATLNYLGQSGYLSLARQVLATKEKLERGIAETGKLGVLNRTDAFITAYSSLDRAIDVHVVADGLEDRGWAVSRLLTPPAIHLPLNPVHAATADLYLADVRAALADAQDGTRIARRVAGGYTGDRDLRIDSRAAS